MRAPAASDHNGHGTPKAAIAAAADNGTGMVGVAPEAWVMPLRVLDARLVGPAGAVASAVDMASSGAPR